MAISLQVLYPVADGEWFDHDYYLATHIPLVDQHMGRAIDTTVVTKGISGGPDTPASYHAIATFIFADRAAFQQAMAAAGPVLADIPNFTDMTPQMLIGEVIG